MSSVGTIIAAVVHRLDRTRGCPPALGDSDYIAPGAPGYVAPKTPGQTGYVAPMSSFVGEQYRAQNDAAPRLVWVPTTDSFGPPIRIATAPRAIRSRLAGIDVDFWAVGSAPITDRNAQDLAAAEVLLHQLLVALHQEMRARFGAVGTGGDWYELRGVEWQTEGQLTMQGCGGRLGLALRLPVEVGTHAHVRPLTLTMTQDIDFDL